MFDSIIFENCQGILQPNFQNQQQSRLNQWINKDKEELGEFSRAPGSSSKPMTTSPNINPLGLNASDGYVIMNKVNLCMLSSRHSFSPWSSGRSADSGWPDSGNGDSSNDVKDAQWSTPAQPSLTDLVPEFEPGKPWKVIKQSRAIVLPLLYLRIAG